MPSDRPPAPDAAPDLCEFCRLPRAPQTLPESYDPDGYCWRTSRTCSNFEAADTRRCMGTTLAQRAAEVARLTEERDRAAVAYERIMGALDDIYRDDPRPASALCKVREDRAKLAAAERRAAEAEYRCEQWAANSVERRDYDEAVAARERAERETRARRLDVEHDLAAERIARKRVGHALQKAYAKVRTLTDQRDEATAGWERAERERDAAVARAEGMAVAARRLIEWYEALCGPRAHTHGCECGGGDDGVNWCNRTVLDGLRDAIEGKAPPLAEAVRVLAGALDVVDEYDIADHCDGDFDTAPAGFATCGHCTSCRTGQAVADALAHPAVVSALALATGATPASGGEQGGGT